MASNQKLEGPKDLSRLIAYQEGAVVSREIIQRTAGTVTLFAFDEGQGLSEHTAPFDALVIVTDGEAEIAVAGRKSAVPAGHIMPLPAGKPHSLKAVKKFKMLLVMIRSEK